MTTIDTRPEAGVVARRNGRRDGLGRRSGRDGVGVGSRPLTTSASVGCSSGSACCSRRGRDRRRSVFGFERLQPGGLFARGGQHRISCSRSSVSGSSFLVVAPLAARRVRRRRRRCSSVPVRSPCPARPRSASGPGSPAASSSSSPTSTTVVPCGGDENMVDLFLMGLALACIGLVIAAGSVVVSVLTTRAPGMTIARVPLFAWSALVGGAAPGRHAAGARRQPRPAHRRPPLLGAPRSAATTGSHQWMGWALTQPATYVYAVPAARHRRRHRRHGDRAAPADARHRHRSASRVFGDRHARRRHAAHRTTCLGAATSFFDDFGDKISDLLPYALFNLLPILGVLMVLGLGGLAHDGAAGPG